MKTKTKFQGPRANLSKASFIGTKFISWWASVHCIIYKRTAVFSLPIEYTTCFSKIMRSPWLIPVLIESDGWIQQLFVNQLTRECSPAYISRHFKQTRTRQATPRRCKINLNTEANSFISLLIFIQVSQTLPNTFKCCYFLSNRRLPCIQVQSWNSSPIHWKPCWKL